VVSVDDANLTALGAGQYGVQHMVVDILEGPEKGKRFNADNTLRAQLEVDKVFRAGDTALVVVPPGGAKAQDALVARDIWRNGWSGLFFAVFCACLCWFGGLTGAKALFSFIFSCLLIWKAVVPLCLAGWPPSWTIFGAVCLLTGVIMYLVAGPTRKGLAAFLGAILGVFSGLALAHVFGRLMQINGATLPYVQTLLNTRFAGLDIQDIFIGAVVLASSGAVMDLAMDIAAGVEEIVRRNPDLPRRELWLSGMRIGRSVVGTMTTTLLLAYSGGYITLLMVFCAQGTKPADFLNSTLVSAEVVKTLVGSFALVWVAPCTALASACVFKSGRKA
jgi:uncharacterized membrane protein